MSNNNSGKVEDLIYWGLINLEGNPNSFDGQEEYRKRAKAYITNKVKEEVIKELQRVSDRLVELGVPVANYDDPEGLSKVGHMFSDRIRTLKKKG